MDLARARSLLLVAINRVRAAGCSSAGSWLPPTTQLSADARLDAAAQAHSEEQARRGVLDHTSASGASSFDRMRAQGYGFRTAAENIASGSTTAEATLAQWLGSDGHCRALMSALYVHAGVGHAVSGSGVHYWTLDLAAP
jgi:uncharacterized protein YkwD